MKNKHTSGKIEEIQSKALKIAERNLASGNWTVETTQLFLRGAEEQPEQYIKYIRSR